MNTFSILFATFYVVLLTNEAFVDGRVSPKPCQTNFFYDIGPTPGYFFSCTCGPDTNILSTVNVTSPGPMGLSKPQFSRTLHCFERERKHRKLDALCGKDPKAWQDHSEPIIRRCARNGLTAPSSPPFSFDSTTCTSTLVRRRQFGATILASCRCAQSGTDLRVIGGVVLYNLIDTPDPTGELDAIVECLEQFKKPMNRECSSQTGRYEEISLQYIRTCCKRVRSTYSNPLLKKKCEETVPENINAL